MTIPRKNLLRILIVVSFSLLIGLSADWEQLRETRLISRETNEDDPTKDLEIFCFGKGKTRKSCKSDEFLLGNFSGEIRLISRS
jgi:hypothetical protein